jgi:hypothetical protein
MLDWLYELFVTIVTFVMSLFGFDLNKRSVALESSADAPKEEKAEHVEPVKHVEPVEAVAKEPVETATELP